MIEILTKERKAGEGNPRLWLLIRFYAAWTSIQIPGRAGELAVSGLRLPLDFPSVAAVLIRKADFLQFGGDSACVEDGAEMGLHGGEDFGSVGHDAEHVGDVAALGECLVEKSCQLRGDFAAVKPGNPRHRASFGLFLSYRLPDPGFS